MNYIIETILDLLFPRRCPVCGQIIMPKGNLICPGCIRKLSWVRGPVCKCCGKEIISETAEYCSDCAIHPRSFSNGMALLNYNEISAPSLAKIKYHNHREYLDFYAEAAQRKYAARIRHISIRYISSFRCHPLSIGCFIEISFAGQKLENGPVRIILRLFCASVYV